MSKETRTRQQEEAETEALIYLWKKKKRKTQTKQGIVYTQLQRTKHQQRRLKPYKYRMGKEEKG